ncbi:MAG: GNAT family N-acetyltransferase [Fimbriimonadaceae bacterium]
MTEIRPVREEEAISFLTLVCDVFELDIARARAVFFNEPMFDLNRKWALIEDGAIRSVLTTVPLLFGWGDAIGIASVATHPSHRGRGLAKQLLLKALADPVPAYLFAADPRMYQEVGFNIIDEMVKISVGSERPLEEESPLSHDEVREIYDRWSLLHPNRLRRDDRRWQLWKWAMRYCVPTSGGYTCIEGNTIREIVADAGAALPAGFHGEFFGLKSMAEKLALGVGASEGFLMGRGTDQVPEMFLSDQF